MFAIQSTTSLRRAYSPFDSVSDSRLSTGQKNLRERLGDAAWDNRGTGFISVTVCRVSGLPPILWSLGSWSDIQSWCSKAPAILRNVHWKDGPPIFPSAGSQHASTSCQPRMVVPWAQGNAAGSSPSLQLSQILLRRPALPLLGLHHTRSNAASIEDAVSNWRLLPSAFAGPASETISQVAEGHIARKPSVDPPKLEHGPSRARRNARRSSCSPEIPCHIPIDSL